MREAVSDVLAERSRAADGLSRMVTYSFLAHVGFVAALAVLPSDWISHQRPVEETPLMISLDGGAPGPDTGGKNQIAGREIQAVAPPEPKEPFARAPADKPPEMVVPEVKPKPAPKSRVERPSEKSSSRKPITGEEVKPGERIDTGGVAVPFGGLSSSGGQGLEAQTLGLDNFCCPDYLRTMIQLIRRNWDQKQGAAGTVIVRYVVRRDGMLTQVEVMKSSHNVLLDYESRRAVIITKQLPPLPTEFTDQNLTVHLTFEYKR